MRAKAPAKHSPAPQAPPHGAQRDQRLVLLALVIIVAVLTGLRQFLPLGGPMSWSYQVIVLCLVLAAAVGRALRPRRPERKPAVVTWRVPEYALLPLVFLSAVLPYLPTLWFGFFSDDFSLTSNVGRVHGLADAFTTRVFSVLYRPLHVLAWWAESRLWGYAPLGYHAVNVVLHGLNAMLVYALGKRLTGNRTAGLLAGLLFGLHPLHTEAVVWACSQGDLQAAFFALLSLLCFDLYLEAPHRRRRVLTFMAACICFALAVLAKESALALPGVVVLWALCRRGWRAWPGALAMASVSGLVLAGYLAARTLVLGRFGGYDTQLNFWSSAFPTVPLRQIYSFFFPANQDLYGQLPMAASRVLWPLTLAAMGLFLFLCVRDLLALPGRRLGLYLGSVVLLAVPVWALPPVSVNGEYARFAYLPTIALMWLVADLWTASAPKAEAQPRLAPALGVAVAAVLCLWQLVAWRGAQRLVTQTVASAVTVIRATPRGAREPVFFVKDLPDTTLGAQVFRHGFEVAVRTALGRPALVEAVAVGGDIPPEVLAMSSLQPGEYVYEWQPKSQKLALVQSGEAGGGER